MPERDRVLEGIRRLASEGEIPVQVKGSCMEPLILDGSRLEIRRSRFYWPGDVIAFRDAAGRLLVHRVLGYRPAARRLLLVTGADVLEGIDPPLPAERILGKVAGGECDVRAARVPWSDRWVALRRFARQVGHRLRR